MAGQSTNAVDSKTSGSAADVLLPTSSSEFASSPDLQESGTASLGGNLSKSDALTQQDTMKEQENLKAIDQDRESRNRHHFCTDAD